MDDVGRGFSGDGVSRFGASSLRRSRNSRESWLKWRCSFSTRTFFQYSCSSSSVVMRASSARTLSKSTGPLMTCGRASCLGCTGSGVSASGSSCPMSSVGMQNVWSRAYLWATAIALLVALSEVSRPSPMTVQEMDEPSAWKKRYSTERVTHCIAPPFAVVRSSLARESTVGAMNTLCFARSGCSALYTSSMPRYLNPCSLFLLSFPMDGISARISAIA